MTPALRTARALTAAAVLTTATAAWLAATNAVWWAVAVGYVTALLAYCAQRSRADHHRILAAHDRARRLATGELIDDGLPCCSLWTLSAGEVHGPGCLRPHDPDAELQNACCTEGFVSRGLAHTRQCRTTSARVGAA
ncbi:MULTISPECIES: hypothetical protein [unclassified Streptomyces]|uniref:hypothetical protein n=1 Tax=unclassified Streptomyces TaxID=2593676 RepID=UPI00136D210C|nr:MULTISPECIES: hypothetical protein [unclassified Streptomyces]MYT70908.1 hypothetical protein [Streptomyces sp. SID8367]